MHNLKDTVTTICGIIIALSGGIYAADQAGIILPPKIVSFSVLAGIIATSVLAYFSGKNPNGSTKSPEQIADQMKLK